MTLVATLATYNLLRLPALNDHLFRADLLEGDIDQARFAIREGDVIIYPVYVQRQAALLTLLCDQRIDGGPGGT